MNVGVGRIGRSCAGEQSRKKAEVEQATVQLPARRAVGRHIIDASRVCPPKVGDAMSDELRRLKLSAKSYRSLTG